jgi:GNAT superfamily N-acetyltransferase
MQLLEVGHDAALITEFLHLPIRLYKNDPCWIRPLDKDIEVVFDPKRNKLFAAGGECIRWVLRNEAGQSIGRVAAFVNKKTLKPDQEQPTGGMGFFECIDDQTAAFRLFDACREWLAAQGMEAMDGPINFGDRDRWWGLLVEGFDKEPNYGMPYTKPYYVPFFENYGFRDYFQQHTFALPIGYDELMANGMQQKVLDRAQAILDNPEYVFEHIRKNNLPQYAADFARIYNEAWAKILGSPDMTADKALGIMKEMKPVMEENLVWFGYHLEPDGSRRPVAFFIMLPELNQYFKHVNGKMDWKGLLTFGYHKYLKPTNKAFGVIFGVVPDFQGKGIESAIAIAYPSREVWGGKKHQYNALELNWIGDFNVRMIRFSRSLGGKISKRHITYRYLFDREKEFKRHKVI